MQVSSEYKLSALLKGGADTAHRLLDSVAPLRASVSPQRLRERWELLNEKPAVRRLVDPHAVLSASASARVAVAVAACSMLIAVLARVHFDGALDVHRGLPLASPIGLTIDLAISWLLTAAILWVACLMADREERADGSRASMRDFMIAVGVARVPTLVIALLVAILPPPEMLADSLLRGLLLLPFFVWFLGLLYTGFQHVSGLRGRAALIPFLGGLVTAEAISKAIIGSV
jgi:hypothetical protein